MSLKKNLILLVVAIALLILSFKFLPFHCYSKLCLEESVPTMRTETILLNNIPIKALVADTEAERVQGLSGRNGLNESEGMLFVFDVPNKYGIWMKNMNFPIDIVWADGGKIISIEKSVSPTSYPKVFYPTTSARFVLELPAGFCDTHDLKVGDSFSQGL